jgi:hypothetical protein
VQVSPVDIQAWASDTGSEYPATAAEKAAVLPAVAAWKAEQLADAKASRGDNAISPLAAGIGAAGLGLAGLVAFNHFRKQGLSEPEAAAMAKQAEKTAGAAAPAAAVAPGAATQSSTTAQTNHRLQLPSTQNTRQRSSRFDGPGLRFGKPAEDAAAATLETRGGRSTGANLAREQGQYKARSDQGFHNPLLAALDTPEKREVYLAGVADASGTDSEAFAEAQKFIAALETTTPSGVTPTSFIAGLSPEQRFGSTTAAEQASAGKALGQSRTKSNASAQAGFQSRDAAAQSQAKTFSPQARANQQADALAAAIAEPGPGDMGATSANNSAIDPEVLRQLEALKTGKGNIEVNSKGVKIPKPSAARRPTSLDPNKASVFFLDVDGAYKPYLGSKPVMGPGDVVLSSGRRADGSPIAESDLAFFPTDDPEFYRRSGGAISHPFLSDIDIAENRGSLPDHRFATDEDQGIKGMLESLPASDSRFSDGIRKDGVSDNWVFGRDTATGDRVPLDVSGFQSEASNPTRLAATRLRTAVGDHLRTTGQLPSPGVQNAWATDLARQHSVDPVSVLRAAKGVSSPAPERTPRATTHALGAGSGDALDRIYTSLGMHAGADAWELEGMVRSGDIKGAAAALASQLPALTSVNAGGLRGASQDEKLGIVAEGVSAGLKDLAITLEKYPQAAAKFGIGKGAGGFGIDAYLKSYVRDWVTVRGLQLDPTGQPTYQVPNDAFEVIAHQAHQAGRSTLAELESHVRGSASGLEGALKIDRLVSAAQSTKQGDPNTNATNFAQLVFDLKDPDLVSTTLTQEAAGDVKLSFGTRRRDDATAGFYDRNPNEAQLADAIGDYTGIAYERDAEYIDSERFPEQYKEALKNNNYNIESRSEQADYPLNSVLAARVSGADYTSDEGRAQQQAAKDAQAWVTANATRLEQERADLNRGILRTDGTPRSFGRGFVLSADQRGAYLAGDTQGINTSIRDEQFNDLDATPLDRAQDNQREAVLNNQVPEPDGIDAADDRPLVPVTEAEATARQYGGTKLHFKNLGPNSNGAMAPGEAFYPRQQLRRYLQERGQDESVGRILDSYMGSGWQAPDLSRSGSFLNEDGSYSSRDTNLIDLDPHQRGGGRAAQGDEWRDLRKYGAPTVLNSDPRWFAPGFTAGGTSPEEAAAMRSATLEARELTGGRHRTVAWDPEGRPFIVDRAGSGMVQGPRRPSAPFETGGAIDPYATYGARGITSDPRPQITDFDQISQLTGKTPRFVVQPEANTETAARHRAAVEARGVNGSAPFRDDQQLRDASDRSLLDRGEVSGVGRRGSTFEQDPIAAAPISSVPAAALEQLNTLRSSLERPVAKYSEQETADARARHIGSYISSAATPTFDKAGRQTSGWTGGDSWRGGARPAGRADRNVGPYNSPSDAMISALVQAARRRPGAS